MLRLPVSVDMACIMSMVSGPLTSPTMMWSGCILRAVRMSCRIVTSPAPLHVEIPGFHPHQIGHSLYLSSVAFLSRLTLLPGMNWHRALRSVVFPEPVPPLIKMLKSRLGDQHSGSPPPSPGTPGGPEILHGDLLQHT